MATTQNNYNYNNDNNDDDDDTNDCPICLCPLSTPWGICTPCGHAYCRGCWDELTASHCNSSSGQHQRNNNNRRGKPSCAVCKTACKEFVTVFVDLNVASLSSTATSGGGATVAAAAAATAQDHNMSSSTLQQDDNDIHDENDEKLDQLTNEWGELWKELEMLHPEIITSDSINDDDDDEKNDDEEGGNGQREVAAICANFIDLTQDYKHGSENDDNDDDDDDSASQVPIPSRKMSRKQPKEKITSSPQEQEALQKKEKRTHTILRRFKQLHREMIQLQLTITRQSSSSSTSSSFTTMSTQQTQKIRSKLIKLQSSNTNLTSQLQSHQSEVDTLHVRVDTLQMKLTERTVETEKEKRKAKTVTHEFNLMEQSYQKHVSKSSIEQNALKSDIRRLQDQVTKLSSESGLQDLQEMEEIRNKYSKMSQDVHLLRRENTRLTKRLEDERTVWKREVGREKAKYKQMMMVQQSEEEEELAVADDGGKNGARSTSHDKKSIKSRKFSLEGRGGRDPQAMIPPRKMTSIAAAVVPPPPKNVLKGNNPPNKSKAMDILDNTRSRKHSLQQNSLLMSVKRTKATSFAKNAKAPRRSNASAEAAHLFFRRNDDR